MANGRGGVKRSRGASLGPRQAVQFAFTGDLAADLQAFEKGVREKVLRSGARAGALVFYQAMRAKVPVAEGTLYGSIYHWHDEKRSNATRQVYAVGPNKAKAPHWHLIENGHWVVNVGNPATGRWTATRRAEPLWVPAQPYIRPAWDMRAAAGAAAVQRMKVRFSEIGGGQA